jgi:hypothetical protein
LAVAKATSLKENTLIILTFPFYKGMFISVAVSVVISLAVEAI